MSTGSLIIAIVEAARFGNEILKAYSMGQLTEAELAAQVDQMKERLGTAADRWRQARTAPFHGE